MNNEITMTNQEAISIISTLKEIKPRGFDSMNRVVGLVMFFESKLNAPPADNGTEVK